MDDYVANDNNYGNGNEQADLLLSADPEDIQGINDAENNENSNYNSYVSVDVADVSSTFYQGAFTGFGVVGGLGMISLGVSMIIFIFRRSSQT